MFRTDSQDRKDKNDNNTTGWTKDSYSIHIVLKLLNMSIKKHHVINKTQQLQWRLMIICIRNTTKM